MDSKMVYMIIMLLSQHINITDRLKVVPPTPYRIKSRSIHYGVVPLSSVHKPATRACEGRRISEVGLVIHFSGSMCLHDF